MRNWSSVPGTRSEKCVVRKSVQPSWLAMRNAAASSQRASHSAVPMPRGARFGRVRVTVDFLVDALMMAPGRYGAGIVRETTRRASPAEARRVGRPAETLVARAVDDGRRRRVGRTDVGAHHE